MARDPECDPALVEFLSSINVPQATIALFCAEQFTLTLLIEHATYEDVTAIVKPIGLRRAYVCFCS